MNYWMVEIKERSQVQVRAVFTELVVISRKERRQGAMETNGRRGKKPIFEGTCQKRKKDIHF